MIASPAGMRIYAPRLPRHLLIRDGDTPPPRLLFHVEQGDYFAALATILGLIADQLETAIRERELPTQYQIDTLKAMHDDLVYLWKHFRIDPK